MRKKSSKSIQRPKTLRQHVVIMEKAIKHIGKLHEKLVKSHNVISLALGEPVRGRPRTKQY